MVVVSIALLALVGVFQRAAISNVDPIVQTRALECAQAKLDEILARKFDENTPSGGVPACGSAEIGASGCNGIAADADLDDVGDYNAHNDASKSNCNISVAVTSAGSELGLPAAQNTQFRRIEVTATSDGGGQVVLSAYRANF